MTFDFYLETDTAGWVLNMLQDYTFPNGKPILAYVDKFGARICDQATDGTNLFTYIKNADGSNLIPRVGLWYRLKMTLTEGEMTLKPANSRGSVGKRGEITSFSDGTILIPCYGSSVGVPVGATYDATSSFAMYMKFDPAKGKWVEIYSYDIPNLDRDESASINEVSLVAPDPDSDTVYAFAREAVPFWFPMTVAGSGARSPTKRVSVSNPVLPFWIRIGCS